MRNLSAIVVNAQTNVTTSFSKIDANQLISASFIATFTDAAAAGTLKLQASNDFDNAGNVAAAAFTPSATSWVDVPSASVVVAAGATSLIPMPLQISYRWLRLVWTRTAGAGTLSVNINAQSV
jgi:hypothetical protein